MRRVFSLCMLIILALLFLACRQATPESGSKESRPSSEIRASTPDKENWQREWEKIIKEAKKEKTVFILGGGGPESRNAIIAALKEKFGLNAEMVEARGGELAQKLLTERRAGVYTADIYLGGGNSLLNSVKPGQVLEPLEPNLLLPEVLDPKAWWDGKLPFVDKDRLIFSVSANPSGEYVINTNLVQEGEVLSYRNILNPKWKGKIVMDDPTTGAGSGIGWFYFVAHDLQDLDFFRELAKLELVLVRDRRQLVEWVAKGKMAIGLAPQKETVIAFTEAGAPLKMIFPKEGGYVASGSGNVSLINRAPHPNAARVFLNWILGKEGGTVFSKVTGYQSARVDVPTNHLVASGIRQPGTKYYSHNDEVFFNDTPSLAKVSREIFGSLLK